MVVVRFVVASSLVTVAIWSLAGNTARAYDVSPSQLVEKVSDQYRRAKFEIESLDVLVIAAPSKPSFTVEDAKQMASEGGRGITHKRAVRKVDYAPDRHDRISVRFSLPREDAGTGFLVLRQPDSGQDDQWLYMPALKKARRVPVSSTATFVGTDFLYEDVRELGGEQVARYVYEAAGNDIVDGQECSVIIAKPATQTNSAYSRRKLWVDTKRLFVLKIEYYDSGDTPWKVLRASQVREVAPGIQRADLSEMRDLHLNEATLLWATERQIGNAIPPEVFTRDYLESAGD